MRISGICEDLRDMWCISISGIGGGSQGSVVDLTDLWWILGICGGSQGSVVDLGDLWWILGICGGSQGSVVDLRDLWWISGICGGSQGSVVDLRDLRDTCPSLQSDPQNLHETWQPLITRWGVLFICGACCH